MDQIFFYLKVGLIAFLLSLLLSTGLIFVKKKFSNARDLKIGVTINKKKGMYLVVFLLLIIFLIPVFYEFVLTQEQKTSIQNFLNK